MVVTSYVSCSLLFAIIPALGWFAIEQIILEERLLPLRGLGDGEPSSMPTRGLLPNSLLLVAKGSCSGWCPYGSWKFAIPWCYPLAGCVCGVWYLVWQIGCLMLDLSQCCTNALVSHLLKLWPTFTQIWCHGFPSCQQPPSFIAPGFATRIFLWAAIGREDLVAEMGTNHLFLSFHEPS